MEYLLQDLNLANMKTKSNKITIDPYLIAIESRDLGLNQKKIRMR
jgi:hypothetical protein